MNLCLQKQCPWGFAFPDYARHQVDFYGGFRFVFVYHLVAINS